MDDSILLVGLGNPGNKYVNNRHNVGFRVVDAMAAAVAFFSFKKMTPLVDAGMFSLNGRKIILAKPQTFMNLSGRAVRFLIDFYKIQSEQVFVFHDDLDLAFARVKIKKGGGNGGHNGLRSIDELIGKEYWRIRIGIGRPEHKSMASSYVLGDFDVEEEVIVEDVCSEIAKNITLLFVDSKSLEGKLNSIKRPVKSEK
jgi:PTH1 family peptidyl-tRNA hydrolase